MRAETLEKIRPTLFQKGHKNWNERPLMSERVTKDGYIEIKIKMNGHDRNKNWRRKHLWIYENYHKVKVDTSKDCVVFLDQNKRNFDIENLQLIPRSILRVLNNSGRSKAFRWTDNADENRVSITLAKISKAIADLKRR